MAAQVMSSNTQDLRKLVSCSRQCVAGKKSGTKWTIC